jgi:hypothetical protein
MSQVLPNGAQRRPLILVELNEVNFDLVRRYLPTQPLPAFHRLLEGFDAVETFAESRYEQLEPWIQWVSAHSGRTFGEHGVFRLGDGANIEFPQIFEFLEQCGLRVGAVSPMNSRNALQRPAYFVPDPWTQTPSDASGFSRRLTEMLRQTVNENAQGRISVQSLMTLAEVLIRTVSIGRQGTLMRLIARAKGRQWIKALVLDQLLHHVHLHLMQRTKPDVSFLFLNAGAHIQHHYYFNSPHAATNARNPSWYVAPEVDPVLEMLQVYDRILGDYLAIADQGARMIVATGLTQLPYDRVKFYYRLKDHADFLTRLGIRFVQVLPRMTRDFEIQFADDADVGRCAASLAGVRMARDGVALFGDIEPREKALFVTLTYPSEIRAGDAIVFEGGTLPDLRSHTSFVAIKNGMHSTKGFAFVSPGSVVNVPSEPVHVSKLFHLTLDAFGLAVPSPSKEASSIA